MNVRNKSSDIQGHCVSRWFNWKYLLSLARHSFSSNKELAICIDFYYLFVLLFAFQGLYLKMSGDIIISSLLKHWGNPPLQRAKDFFSFEFKSYCFPRYRERTTARLKIGKNRSKMTKNANKKQ